MVVPAVNFWRRIAVDRFYESRSRCWTVTWKASQTNAGNGLILILESKSGWQFFAIRFFHCVLQLLITETPNTQAEKYHCKPKQDSRFRQNVAQTSATQNEIQHTLHCPGGGKNSYRMLDRRREQFEWIPASAHECEDHAEHNA